MTVRTLGDLVSYEETGKIFRSFFHKTSAPTPGAAGRWADFSMASGTPKYNAYVGTQYESTQLVNSGNNSIYLGSNPTTSDKRYLSLVSAACATSTQNIPLTMMLCDYLLHYPLIDGDSTDQQDLDNVVPLPRYENGQGVRMILVATTPMTANGNVTVSYTNQDGSSGRMSSASVLFSTNLGAIVSCIGPTAAVSKIGPFLPLVGGDYGIRSVESVTFASYVGGFMALVLVKPICKLLLREAQTVSEKELYRSNARMPIIENGAFLNFIFQNSGTGNPGVTRGVLEFIHA